MFIDMSIIVTTQVLVRWDWLLMLGLDYTDAAEVFLLERLERCIVKIAYTIQFSIFSSN